MVKLDPWGSFQPDDYRRLHEEFGIEFFDEALWRRLPQPHHLFRRGVVFGHRGMVPAVRALERGEPVGVMTGLMPSGRMHLGHKAVLDQVVWYQDRGADVHVAIADFEAFAARGLTIEEARRLGIEEYVLTYLALGLKPGKSEVYFQTKRTRVKDLAYELGLHVNLGEMRAIYDFKDSARLAHVNAPLMQAGDILHVQRPELGGPRPVIVPVGVDQDPHIRLTRDLAAATRVFSVKRAEDGRFGVFVKPETPPKPVKALLDDVVRILRGDLGFLDLQRNDAYRAVYLPAATGDDVPRIDLALGRYESEGLGLPGFFPPASTYHRFMSGLVAGEDGKPGKMSSSRPPTAIFITDDPATVKKKLMGAVTGGRASAEEQRRLGADPTRCSVYEQFLYHEKDDKALANVYEECTTGKRLCGECKAQAVGMLQAQLRDLKEKREAARPLVDDIVRAD